MGNRMDNVLDNIGNIKLIEISMTKGFSTGDRIRTKSGYEGTYFGSSIDGKKAYVCLNGCTYSDEHWYDIVPMKDIEKVKEKKDPKARKVKGWAVHCSGKRNIQAFQDKDKAIFHAKFLDDEYSGSCIHTVVPCEISYRLPANKKKGK